MPNRLDRCTTIIRKLREATKGYTPTLSEIIIAEYGKDPFLILISCLLSLRARDLVTIHVSRDLFACATTPREILSLPLPELEKIIFRIGFYKQKARGLHAACRFLLTHFNGNVPRTEEELLRIPGVGRKTANLVLGLAYDIPAICVDIHVHRISNRLGLVTTKTPEETEEALKKIIPKENWIEWNKLLVLWGQNVCTPLSPFCSKCVIYDECKRVGVTRSR